jgi:peptide/nickel transport system substrate-binding protein
MSFGLHHLVVLLSVGLQTCWAGTSPGPVVVGQTFLAGSVDPGCDCSDPWALTSHGIAEKLFTVDEYGNIVGQVAQSVSQVSALVWEVTLKSGYKFSDGTAVTAAHVAADLTELNTKNSAAQSSLGTMTVTVSGDLKVRIESTRATHVMDAVLAEWVFVVYYKDTAGNFVFTGPYTIKTGGFAASQIDMIPNTYYDGAAKREEITMKKFSDGHALAESAKKNEVDIGFHLPIDTVVDVQKVKGQSVASFEVGYHYMMFHNTDNLGLNVRKAIDLAIDREALVTALAGGTGTRSLFPDYSPYYLLDTPSSLKGDSTAAETLLDTAGWMLDTASGKRKKDGQELNVRLVAYPHRPGLVIMQPVIKEALTALGITVTTILTGDDWSETSTIIDDRSFDLLLWAQNTLPAGDPLWFLNHFFRSDGGSNHANLNSATVDSLLDTLSSSHSLARVAASKAAQTAILAEVPVSNLVTPFWHVSVSDRMDGYKPWGSDYHVIRSDVVPAPAPSTKDSGAYHNTFGAVAIAAMLSVTI